MFANPGDKSEMLMGHEPLCNYVFAVYLYLISNNLFFLLINAIVSLIQVLGKARIKLLRDDAKTETLPCLLLTDVE